MARSVPAESLLDNLPPFRGQPEEQLARSAADTTKRRLQRSETPFREGDYEAAIRRFSRTRLARNAVNAAAELEGRTR